MVTQDRFSARRAELERQTDQRRLRIVLALTLASTLAMAVIAFVNSAWFDVDEISVSGNQRASQTEVIAASGILVGDGLLSVNPSKAAASVELVPWVGEASVSRQWTGQLEIAVVERSPAAVVPAGPRFALIDEQGRQLEIVNSQPDGYLPVRGIDASGVAGEAAPVELLPVVALLQALPPEVEKRITSINLDDGSLSLELGSGGRVLIGDGADLGAKLQAFETVLARVDTACLEILDVRVPAAPTVRRVASTGGLPSGGSAAPSGVVEAQVPDSASSDC